MGTVMKRPGNQSRNQNNFLILQKRKPGLGTAPMYLSWLTAEHGTRATVPVPRANPCSAVLPVGWARGGEWAWPGHALGSFSSASSSHLKPITPSPPPSK